MLINRNEELEKARAAFNILLDAINLLDPVKDHREYMYWDGCLKTIGCILKQLEEKK